MERISIWCLNYADPSDPDKKIPCMTDGMFRGETMRVEQSYLGSTGEVGKLGTTESAV